MADQKKWVKVWSSILVDPDHTSLSLEAVGRWTRLLAYVSLCGQKGKMTIHPPATNFLVLMGVKTLRQARDVLKSLPNVVIMSPLSGKKCDNDGFALSFKNWFKYQRDPTAYERVKRSRSKKREEEKRREQTPFLSEKQEPKWT